MNRYAVYYVSSGTVRWSGPWVTPVTVEEIIGESEDPSDFAVLDEFAPPGTYVDTTGVPTLASMSESPSASVDKVSLSVAPDSLELTAAVAGTLYIDGEGFHSESSMTAGSETIEFTYSGTYYLLFRPDTGEYRPSRFKIEVTP